MTLLLKCDIIVQYFSINISFSPYNLVMKEQRMKGCLILVLMVLCMNGLVNGSVLPLLNTIIFLCLNTIIFLCRNVHHLI